MALKDFVYVPRVNGYNGGGEQIIVYDNYNPYRVAYQSENEYAIRAGVYRIGYGQFQIEIVSDTVISSGIDIYLQSPYLTVVASRTSITDPLPNGLSGYHTFFTLVKDRMSTSIKGQSNGVKWWDSLTDLYEALAFGDIPSPGSGVIVTVNASPLTPSTSGVVVYVTGRLLDPNEQGGTSVTGGGQGTFNDMSYPVPIPTLPSLSAADCGMVALFRPTKAQLNSLASYLWTNLTDFIENLNKLFMHFVRKIG